MLAEKLNLLALMVLILTAMKWIFKKRLSAQELSLTKKIFLEKNIVIYLKVLIYDK